MTLIEALLGTMIAALVVATGSGLYIMGQRAWSEGVSQAEELQNARVSMDRISRELRQAKEIADTQTNSILFEDGHDTSRLQYVKYLIDTSNDLRRQVITYGKSGALVRYDVPGAQSTIEIDEIVAESITSLTFTYDTLADTIEINLSLEDKVFKTKINPRNVIS